MASRQIYAVEYDLVFLFLSLMLDWHLIFLSCCLHIVLSSPWSRRPLLLHVSLGSVAAAAAPNRAMEPQQQGRRPPKWYLISVVFSLESNRVEVWAWSVLYLWARLLIGTKNRSAWGGCKGEARANSRRGNAKTRREKECAGGEPGGRLGFLQFLLTYCKLVRLYQWDDRGLNMAATILGGGSIILQFNFSYVKSIKLIYLMNF